MIILAFDLATRSGWCIGKPGQKVPRFGSLRFASQGASHQAVFAGALTWFSDFLKAEQPDRIVYEAPMRFRAGRSRAGNDEVAYGLPAILQAVAHLRGIYDIRYAEVSKVRHHFLGHNPKRAIAKPATVRRCQQLGWNVPDDNAGDACAIWMYACAFVDPRVAIRPTPLFSGQPSHGDELL